MEVEEKGLLLDSQSGFRKRKSTLDNIFVLNHIIQKVGEKDKGERIFAFFADLKSAFDKIDRQILWKTLKDMKIDEGTRRRLEKIYEETEVTVRTGQGLTEGFWTEKGVRQGCVLSPLLFNLYIAELDSVLEKRGIGGVKIGEKRIWNLAYADDIVLLAKNKEALSDMMDTFRNFLEKKKLELCVEKSKVLVFNRKGKERKDRWNWKGKNIEEVQEFKYLGFVFNKNGNYKDHIKELIRKGKIATKRVWGLDERICKNDFKRRWMLFNYLIQSVMSYGVELWGWEEKRELEKVMMDYTRWIFRLDFCTPRYIIQRELRMDKLKVGWGIRAVRYEEKVRNSQIGSLLAICWKEKKVDKIKDKYSLERKEYYKQLGWELEDIEEIRREKNK